MFTTKIFYRAEAGDYSMLHELLAVLSKPYDNQSEEITKRWYTKTPAWAKKLPGVTFLS